MPGSLSTSTATVCRSTSATRPSDKHHSLLGDRFLGFVLGTQQHFVVSRARRDHRETILLWVYRNIENHGAVDRQHLDHCAVDLGRVLDTPPDRAEGVSELYEIGQRRGIALGVAAAVQQFLPLAHHAHVLVVENKYFDRQSILCGGRHLLDV